MNISGGIPNSEEADLLLPAGRMCNLLSVFSVILSLCRAVGAVAFHIRIPEVTAAPILSSISLDDSHGPVHPSTASRQVTKSTMGDWSWEFDIRHTS